ncbi:AMP-binding protein [Halomarina litorea]|uniref:AMP-binding protein n=1 Tax=Halomarina litorea TaxID=2961595 RepID=UPI0020C1C075|nr:AMP-binding protein [Halomarina sp. BCD28]
MVTTAPNQYPAAIEPEPRSPLGEQPLHQYLSQWANETPENSVINYYGNEISYRELDDAVDRFAQFLTSRGYGRGDTLLLFLQNSPQYYIGYYAAHRLGLRASPCSPMAKGHRVSYQLDDGDVDVVLAQDTYSDVVESVRGESSLEDVVYTRLETYLPDDPTPDLHDDMTDAIETDRQPTGDSTRYLSSVLDETNRIEQTPETAMDDVALLQYTSGTTGMPKGCKHTHRTILYKAASNATAMGYNDATRFLEVMPIFHVAGKLFGVDTPMVSGGTTVLLTRYSPDALLEAIDAHRPTMSWLTTPMVRSVLGESDVEQYALTSLERTPTTSFGQALTEELCQKWHEVTEGEMFEAAYGLSETHTMDTFTRGLGVVEEGFVGRPSHGVDIVVRDWDTHDEVPLGETGEISVKSPSVMKGYLNKPEETRESFYDDYVLTGDVGRMTEEGFLYFLGRRKNMIKTSGYSVSPAEVEQILKEHDAIDNAAVVGRTHDAKGEEVVSFVTSPDETLSSDAIVDWAKDAMAAYKRPRAVFVVEELPTTDVGKLDRQRLEEMVD